MTVIEKGYILPFTLGSKEYFVSSGDDNTETKSSASSSVATSFSAWKISALRGEPFLLTKYSVFFAVVICAKYNPLKLQRDGPTDHL